MSKTEKEKMLAGELYDCSDPELHARWHVARKLVEDYRQTDSRDRKKMEIILDQLLGARGNNVWISPPFFCDYGDNIFIGDNTEINFNCTILDCNKVTIGNNVLIAPNVQIYAVTHPVRVEERLPQKESGSSFCLGITAPVTICDNVWIGGGAIILPGVTIGENTTIGAGSVVTKSIPANVVAVGNPCKVIRTLK